MNRETLANLVRTEGRLPINLLSQNASEGFQELEYFFRTSPEDLLDKVENLDIPSDNDRELSKRILNLIAKFKNLRSLTCKGGWRKQDGSFVLGCIVDIPKDSSFMKSLSYLDLSFNDLSQFPEWIFWLENLQRLQLNFCNIKQSLPAGIGNFLELREIHLKENTLCTLPDEFSKLGNVKIINLSSNNFGTIPSVILNLQSLKILDLSDNAIEGLLSAPTNLKNLEIFKLRSNKIVVVDDMFLKMPLLKCLDLRLNAIRSLSQELQSNEYFLFDGNPIGYQSPERNSKLLDDSYQVPKYVMDSDTCYMKYEMGKGAECTLPCGMKIVLPKSALNRNATLYSEILPDSEIDFALDDLDSLLSGVLQLSPSGLTFDNPVKLSMPYSFERNDQQIREILVRAMSDDGTVEDLDTITTINPAENSESYIAESHTTHFSKFAVVARIMEASTIIKKDCSHLLFSPAYPQTKLKFEEGSAEDGTRVTMKVINVDPSIVREVSESLDAMSSCILSIQVSPLDTIFKRPVTVRIALPDELLGKDFNHKDLKLMKCAHGSIEWQDVTSVTPLQISTVDVSFQALSFSKFIVVKELVCGVVRYIYRRLRTYKVQFIAMQKRSLPTQILAQCVLEKSVSQRLKQLQKSGYASEDATTEVQEMLEGSTYKIQIIGDLQLQKFNEKLAQRAQKKNLFVRFFSQYPPDKKGFSRFFIEPREMGKKCQTGFVSFYRLDEEIQKVTTITAKEVSTPPRKLLTSRQKRKIGGNGDGDTSISKDEVIPMEMEEEDEEEEEFNDENHLGDVPVALQGDVLDRIENNNRPPDLDFGGLGTGMFREDNLRLLANQVGNEWREIGTFLGLSHARLDQIASDYPGNLSAQIFKMLKTWSDLHMTDEDCIEQFLEALRMAGRNDLAHKVKTLHEEGKREFHNSVKSLRLDQD